MENNQNEFKREYTDDIKKTVVAFANTIYKSAAPNIIGLRIYSIG